MMCRKCIRMRIYRRKFLIICEGWKVTGERLKVNGLRLKVKGERLKVKGLRQKRLKAQGSKLKGRLGGWDGFVIKRIKAKG